MRLFTRFRKNRRSHFLDESYPHAIKRAPLHLFAVELGLETAHCPAPLLSDQYIVSLTPPHSYGSVRSTPLFSLDSSALFRAVTYQKIGSWRNRMSGSINAGRWHSCKSG